MKKKKCELKTFKKAIKISTNDTSDVAMLLADTVL